MKSDDAIREATAATLQFERDLESLVLAAFADGARIEGTWTVEVPVTTAPNWTVELRKERGEADRSEASNAETDAGETDSKDADGGETDDSETDDGETDDGDVGGGETDGGYVPELFEE